MIDTSQDKPEECECCQFKTEDLKAYGNTSATFRNSPPNQPSHKWLCILCASTTAGTAHEYRNNYTEGHTYQILQAICFVGNSIIAEIRRSK